MRVSRDHGLRTIAPYRRTGWILAVALAAAVSLFASPASATTQHFVVEFSDTHACTHEQVSGETRVTIWMDSTENADGTTSVTVRQHRHGSDLRGDFSGDKYVLNERTETEEHFVVDASTGGTFTVRTTFIHYTERQAFTEVPGQDDLHQYLTFTFLPLVGATLTDERTECR